MLLNIYNFKHLTVNQYVNKKNINSSSFVKSINTLAQCSVSFNFDIISILHHHVYGKEFFKNIELLKSPNMTAFHK